MLLPGHPPFINLKPWSIVKLVNWLVLKDILKDIHIIPLILGLLQLGQNWWRLTAGGRLCLHKLHPSGLITNPVVRLVHKMCKVINNLWNKEVDKRSEMFIYALFMLFAINKPFSIF